MDNETTKLSFRDILDSSVTNLSGGTNLTIADILLALLMSFICGLIITWVYKKSYQGVVYQKSFNLGILMVSMITTSVIMVISGNLILSLGMVGALSIIRFRAAIKDPIDIVFMFWAVSIGIANGVANFKVALIATLFIAFIILYFKDRPQPIRSYMLICNYEASVENQVLEAVSKNTTKFGIKSKSLKDDLVELILEVRLKEGEEDVTNEISKIERVSDATLMSYSNSLLDQ